MTECPFNLILIVSFRATEEPLLRLQSSNRTRLPPAQIAPPKTTLRLRPESGTFRLQINLFPTTVAGPPRPRRQERRHSRPGRRSWHLAATWGMIRGRRRDRSGGSSERRGRRTDRPSCSCVWRTPNRLRWNPVSVTMPRSWNNRVEWVESGNGLILFICYFHSSVVLSSEEEEEGEDDGDGGKLLSRGWAEESGNSEQTQVGDQETARNRPAGVS